MEMLKKAQAGEAVKMSADDDDDDDEGQKEGMSEEGDNLIIVFACLFWSDFMQRDSPGFAFTVQIQSQL